ncbi:hypothetical protein MMC07_000700 [Pseudocyphellaria aurata]|nr:hypothetical protein [Pseudocyphellaria aurata]
MGIFSRVNGASHRDPNPSSEIPTPPDAEVKPISAHAEISNNERAAGWNQSRAGGGDTAALLLSDPDAVNDVVDPNEAKKLERKIDFMILPYLAVCYAFFYIDKTTLSYAAIFNIREDLNLKGTQYNWLSSIFYFGFLAWAFPTNFLMQRLPIGKYLGANIFMWGFFLMLQAACKNFATLATLRALGGAAEACSDPSFMLITSMWYSRRQQPVRIGIWYTANGVGIAGGGLLGYAIGNIKGSLPSWKYEFLIIGALCSLWGIVMFIKLPDSPVTAKSLTPKQRRMAIERLREDQTGVENKHLKWYQVREAFADFKLYMFFLIGVVANIPNGGISNFGTIIIKGFGFSTLVTTLMQVPYGIIIAISILACVFLNDRSTNKRCLFIVLFLLPNIAGAFGLKFLAADRKIGRLISYYLTGPYNAAFVLILSLQTANTAGPFFYKDAQS